MSTNFSELLLAVVCLLGLWLYGVGMYQDFSAQTRYRKPFTHEAWLIVRLWRWCKHPLGKPSSAVTKIIIGSILLITGIVLDVVS